MSNILGNLRRYTFFAALLVILIAAHLCHLGVLWAEESLPLAVALQLKRGSLLYRDVWFDKPPLIPAVYLIWGVHVGPVLRIAGALYAFAACLLSYAIAAGLWTRREGYLAAGLLAFFLTFDTHSAVLPLAADLLLVVPHVAAILLAARRYAFWSGVAAGIGFLFNAKGLFVLAACAVFAWPNLVPLAAGFIAPNAIALTWLSLTGSLESYVDQVWRWPAKYAGSTFVANPLLNGIVRTVNWFGFHAVLIVGAFVFFIRERSSRFAIWTILCYAGVVLGWRFFPRYFFLLLPPLVIAAARGITLLRSKLCLAIVLLSIAVPLIRFGPRYVVLANDLVHGRRTEWADLSMDEDSRAAAQIVRARAQPSATLFVWGYRPEIFVYTGLRPSTKYLECQAMTGVPADRHLTQSQAVLTSGTRQAREELARSHPDILIDGLSPFNPALSMDHYDELRLWLRGYHFLAQTKGTIIYLRDGSQAAIR